MEIDAMAECLNKLFPACLDYFSMQRSEHLLNNVDMFVADQDNAKIKVNYGHPLFCNHPENVFALKSMVTTFLEYCAPRLSRIPAPTSLYGTLQAQLLDDAVEVVHRELYRRLSMLTFGLDIDFITALSGEMYESSAATNFQLVILPNETALCGVSFDAATRWELKIRNLHAIRKQLNLANHGALAVAPPSVGAGPYPCTLGFINSSEADRFPRFRFVGHMAWEFHVPCASGNTCRMRYWQGHLTLPGNILEKEIFCAVNKIFSSVTQSNRIKDVIVQLLKQNRGAVAVFSKPDVMETEVQRLVRDLQRGIAPVNVIPVAGRPKNLRKTELLEQAENLKRITEIDGAVLIDTNGNCHAFGVILDGECTPQSKGDMSRGARLNSTRAYIGWKRSIHSGPWLGAVISEDGMFDLL